jgi:hypothetical protein
MYADNSRCAMGEVDNESLNSRQSVKAKRQGLSQHRQRATAITGIAGFRSQ